MTFENLENEVLYEPLDAVVDQIRMLINSSPPTYTPETVQALIDAVVGMNAELGQKLPKAPDAGSKAKVVRQVIQQAEAKFMQPGWKPEQVINAQNIFNFGFEPIKKEVEEPAPSTKIPVVLLVMTRAEAGQLDGNRIPVTMPADYWQEFMNLRNLLDPDWIDRYGKTPEKWQPFGTEDKNIEGLLSDLFAEVRDAQNYEKLLVPEFIDVRTLHQNRKRLRDLRHDGCFVINDVISMWHPDIQRQYRASLLEAFPTTIVFRIAPIDQALGDTQPLIAFQESYADLEFFKRIRSDRDMYCRSFLSANQRDDFESFVFNLAPTLIPSSEKSASPVTRQIIGSSRRKNFG